MSKIEKEKTYSGRDLETVFFRPIMTGPSAEALGIRMMYNMPVPTTLHFWGRMGDVLQKYGTSGWTGGMAAEKYQKTINLSKVKAEMGYKAEDYFARVYELITNRADVNLQDLSGTELEDAETALFKEAIAESIRMTMWIGDTEREDDYATFDGFLKRMIADMVAGETLLRKIYDPITNPSDAETLLKDVWDKANARLRAAKAQGNLVYLVTSDIYAKYEEALDNVQLESAYLARQNGRNGISFRGIPVIDLQIGDFQGSDLPQSFVLLTDSRNLALAVNTSDFPGTEVRMWYNPDQMENRQRAVFMAGCDYLLPELISFAIVRPSMSFDKSAVTATGGAVKAQADLGSMMVIQVKACGLNAADQVAGTEVTLARNECLYSGAITGSAIAKVRFTVKYVNGTTQVFVK